MQKGFQLFLGPSIRGPKESCKFQVHIIRFGEDVQHTWVFGDVEGELYLVRGWFLGWKPAPQK